MLTQLSFNRIQQNGGQFALQGNPEGVVYLTHWGPQPSGWGGIIASGASSRVTLTHVVADAGDDDAKETMEYTKESLAASLQQANSLKNALREFRDALKANGLGG